MSGPRMIQGAPIFDYDPIGLHVKTAPSTLMEAMPSLLEVRKEIEPRSGDLCWSGWCNRGCGRALISVTTPKHASPYVYACGLCE